MKKYFFVILVILAIGSICIGENNLPCYHDRIKEMGYSDVSEYPCEVVEFTIPAEFTPVYEKYNELLKTGGYDLSPYRGKTCKRYSYFIPSVNAVANILVYNGEVIGGDISETAIDGNMIPIKKE